jgi:hypothetical protein
VRIVTEQFLTVESDELRFAEAELRAIRKVADLLEEARAKIDECVGPDGVESTELGRAAIVLHELAAMDGGLTIETRSIPIAEITL